MNSGEYGRHGFLLNGQFVEGGIIRSFHPLDLRLFVVIQDDAIAMGASVIGVALCEFGDDDDGAVHGALVLATIGLKTIELWDHDSVGGHVVMGLSSAWPTDEAEWNEIAKIKGSLTHGKA